MVILRSAQEASLFQPVARPSPVISVSVSGSRSYGKISSFRRDSVLGLPGTLDFQAPGILSAMTQRRWHNLTPRPASQNDRALDRRVFFLGGILRSHASRRNIRSLIASPLCCVQPSLACGADGTAIDARSWPDPGHQEYEPTMEKVSLPIRWQCGLATIRVGEASHPGPECPTSSPNVLAVAPQPGLPLPCPRFQDGGIPQSLHASLSRVVTWPLHGSQPSGWRCLRHGIGSSHGWRTTPALRWNSG